MLRGLLRRLRRGQFFFRLALRGLVLRERVQQRRARVLQIRLRLFERRDL
jgi:hypothetical protein